jgi:hypothetical protein
VVPTRPERPIAPAAPPLQQVLERPALQNLILWLIILNAVILGLETSPVLMARHACC